MSSSVSLEYLNNTLADQINLTKTALCAQNTAGSSITVLLGGAAVPLTNVPYNSGFTANGTNTTFTVGTTGAYLVQYSINITAGLLMSATVYRNGAAIANLTRTPGVSGTAFSTAAIVSLSAGDVLQLTLFGLAGTAVLQGGVGAYMYVVRIA